MVVSKVKVYGLENSIIGSKYPMSINIDKLTPELTKTCIKLAQCEKGTGHDNWLNGIIVQFDLTLTIKAWTEAERYHFLDFVSSQSTMHKITKFDLDKAYIEYTDPRCIDVIKEKVKQYNELCKTYDSINDDYEKEKIKELKDEKYLEILYSNPCGMRLTARMTTNYRQLKTIYSQRKTHRLPEWREFCSWIESLPYAKELIIGEKDG